MNSRRLLLAVVLVAVAGIALWGAGAMRLLPQDMTCEKPQLVEDGRVVSADGQCPGIADSILTFVNEDTSRKLTEIALGRTALDSPGVFDTCKLMAVLADDPAWASATDSDAAVAPLENALVASVGREFAAGLAGRGFEVEGAAAETIQRVKSGASGLDCEKLPDLVPETAMVWIQVKRK